MSEWCCDKFEEEVNDRTLTYYDADPTYEMYKESGWAAGDLGGNIIAGMKFCPWCGSGLPKK